MTKRFAIFILTPLLFSISVFAARGEYPFANEGLPDRRVREEWAPEKFSNPHLHKNSEFLYLVHEIDTGEDKWTLPYLENPETIRDQYRISSSVITDEMLGTYLGRIALILKAPKENIGPMHTKDMASGRAKDYEGALTTFRRNKRMFPKFYTPMSLAQATKAQSSSYNEVLVMGSNHSKNTFVTVSGIIVQCMDESFLKGQRSFLLQMNSEAESILSSCLLQGSEAQKMRKNHLTYLMKLADRYPIILMRAEGYKAKF